MDRNMATGELWMREAVKEMMVKHLGFGASVGTNWMLLESDLVAIIAGHAPEQEWEAKEKALRELANEWFHESSRKDVPLLTSMAIDKCRRQLRAMCNEGEGR